MAGEGERFNLSSILSKAMTSVQTLLKPNDEISAQTSKLQSQQSPIASLFTPNACLNYCGSEDIRLAAQKVTEFFSTLQYVVIIFAVFVGLCIGIITIIALKYAFVDRLRNSFLMYETPNGRAKRMCETGT